MKQTVQGNIQCSSAVQFALASLCNANFTSVIIGFTILTCSYKPDKLKNSCRWCKVAFGAEFHFNFTWELVQKSSVPKFVAVQGQYENLCVTRIKWQL